MWRRGTLGLVLGAGAVGGLLGSIVTGRVSRRIGIGPTFALGCFIFPVPLLLVPLADGPQPLVLACLFLAEFGSGLGVMMLDISGATIFAAVVPERMRSRVSGAYMVVNFGVRPLGALVGGALGTWIGLRETLWIATAGALLGILWLLPSPILGLRELPEPEDAKPKLDALVDLVLDGVGGVLRRLQGVVAEILRAVLRLAPRVLGAALLLELLVAGELAFCFLQVPLDAIGIHPSTPFLGCE